MEDTEKMTAQEFRQITGKISAKTVVFTQSEDFAAFHAAEAYCQERGYSVGRMCRDSPIGLKLGEWNIQKWYNLSHDNRTQLDGLITGDKRNGPVTVWLARE